MSIMMLAHYTCYWKGIIFLMLKIQSIYSSSCKYNNMNTMSIMMLAHYTSYWICIIFFNSVHVRLVY